jgi:hypothetical protein
MRPSQPGKGMDSTKELRDWSDFLDTQMAHFEEGIIREKGRSHVADEINAAFLKTDDDLARQDVEAAVISFIRNGSWPQVRAREYLHLMLRAYAARGTLLEILGRHPLAQAIQATIPKLDDRAHMIRWLFIEHWNKGGKVLIAAMTDAFLQNVKSGQLHGKPGAP